MPQYEIEQYELHCMKYIVEADSEAEAVRMVLEGDADAVDNSLEYIEIADEYGIPVDENPELAKELGSERYISTIRSIEEL